MDLLLLGGLAGCFKRLTLLMARSVTGSIFAIQSASCGFTARLSSESTNPSVNADDSVLHRESQSLLSEPCWAERSRYWHAFLGTDFHKFKGSIPGAAMSTASSSVIVGTTSASKAGNSLLVAVSLIGGRYLVRPQL